MCFDLEEEGLVNAQRLDLLRLKDQCGGIDALAEELGMGSIDLSNRIFHPDRVESLPSAKIMARIARKLELTCPYMEVLALRAGYDNLDDFLFT